MATIRITWPANPASEQVTKYEVLQSKDGGPFNSLGFVTSPLKELPNSYPGIYRFKVKALNIAGTSAESDIGEGPGLPSKPGAPVVEVSET